MELKKTLPTMALVLAFAASSGLALAQNNETDAPRQAPPKSDFSPEQWNAFEEMRSAHYQKTAPLRDQMWAKEMEYEALAANPNTKPAEIRAIIDEMVKIRTQLRAERESFFKEMKGKGFGPEFGYHKGFGHGYGKGWGHGKGWGYHNKMKHGGYYGQDRDFERGPGKGPGRHHNWRD